jgi:autotransporter-associated beta strand protein
MRTQYSFLCFIAAIIGFICSSQLAKCQFTVVGYYADPTVPNQYDIIGSGLSQVTQMTISPYFPQGDVNSNVTFNLVSDQELTFTLDSNLSNYVDLTFSDPSYSLIGVTLQNTGGRYDIPLTTVGDGQTLQGGAGGQRVLITAGGTYGNGGGGSNVEFVQNGGTFTGNSGGGSDTTYFEPYAYGSNDAGGGGDDNYIEVNAIDLLSAIDPNSILSGSSTSTNPITISSGSATATGSSTTGYGLLSLASTGTTTLFNYIGGTGVLSPAEISIAAGGTGIISNNGGGILTLPTINENGGTLVLQNGVFIVQGISGLENSDPVIDGSTVGYTTTNSYNGPTTIEHGGALLLGVNGALPTSTYTDLTLGASDDGGAGETNTLDLLGTSQTVDSLTNVGPDINQVISSDGYASGSGTYGAGPVSGTGASSVTGSLTVNTTNYAGGVDTFSGSLGGTGNSTNFSLTKSGTGTLALTGNNTYTGGTTVNGGTLLANSSNSTGSGQVIVANGGTLGGTGTINPFNVTSGNAVTIAGELNPSAGNNNTSTSILTFALNPSAVMNLTSTATAIFDLGKSGVNDQVVINGGTLDLTNATLSNFSFVGLTGINGFTGSGVYDLFAGENGAGINGLGTGSNEDTVDIGGENYTATFNSVGNDLQVSITAAVPEPGTWTMFLVGLGFLAFWYWRDRLSQR